MEEDAKAFNEVINALKLPRNTDDEKKLGIQQYKKVPKSNIGSVKNCKECSRSNGINRGTS